MEKSLEHYHNRNLGLYPIKLTDKKTDGFCLFTPQLPIAPYNLELIEFRNKRAGVVPVMVTDIMVGSKSMLLSTAPVPLKLVNSWDLEQFEAPWLTPVTVRVETLANKMPKGGVIWVLGLVQCRVATGK